MTARVSKGWEKYINAGILKASKTVVPRALSEGEELFALHMKARKLYPVREHQFHPQRKWRFDFAFPDAKPRPIAIEIEGGSHGYGRHNRAQGYEADAEKYNAAQALGWIVLRYTTAMVKSGIAERQVAELMGVA